MRIKSPIVTLLVGVLIAAIVTFLSVRAHNTVPKPYSAAAPAGVVR